MSSVEVRQFPCLSDNYGLLIHDKESGTTVAIDVPEAEAYLDALDATGWKLTHILLTHHHWDHVQGVGELEEATGAKVYGPERSRQKIAAIEVGVEGGDTLKLGPLEVQALYTPGHTIDHLTYWFKDQGIAHTGDTLFAMGCGRIFEGDPEMMWASLQHIVNTLPPETIIYCGHEYTVSNAKFALSVDPDNEALKERAKEVEFLRDDEKPTLPTTMELELKTNPFLRPSDPAIQKVLGMEGQPLVDIFTEIRKRKDNF